MQNAAFLSASLTLSGVFCIVLTALIGYLLSGTIGGILMVAASYSGFELFLYAAEEGLSGFSILLLMVYIGFIWAYIGYLMLNGKLFLSVLLGLPLYGLVLLSLKIALLFDRMSGVAFLVIIFILNLINLYICHENWSELQRVLSSITFAWYVFSSFFWMGHLIAGPIGILMFTTPAILLFWGTLLIVGGGYVLPINNVEERLQNGEYEDTASFKERLERIRSILFQEQEKVSQDDEVNDARRRLEKVGLILRQSYRDARNLFPAFLRDWHQAMKSVLTFILGSNYPYIALLDRKTVTRVKGNRFRKFFAGPGIILSGPDHVAAVWDGFKIRGIPRPGLAFTGAYEEIKESIDLRPQLRTLTVKATTKDGIPVSVFTFVPHRVDPHGRPGATRPEPEPGTSFPYSQASIVKVISQETVEYRREGQGPAQMEFREKGTWDTLVPRKAREILTNVLAEYTFDDLCAPFEMDRDPRTEIRNRFIEDLTETVAPWGIQVVGGGISNIIPPDEEAWTKDTVWRARIDNWRVSWEEEMLKELGYGKAEAMATSYRLKEKVYAKSISQINHALAQSDRPSELASNVLALRVADAIQDMLGDKLVKQCLPMDVIDTLDHLSKAVSGNGAEV